MISRSTPAGKFSSRLSLRNQPCGLDYSFEERKRNEYIPLFDCVLRLYHFVAQVPRSGTGTTKWHRYHEVAQVPRSGTGAQRFAQNSAQRLGYSVCKVQSSGHLCAGIPTPLCSLAGQASLPMRGHKKGRDF